MYRLRHIGRVRNYVGQTKNLLIYGGVVKKPILCQYSFLTTPLVYFSRIGLQKNPRQGLAKSPGHLPHQGVPPGIEECS